MVEGGLLKRFPYLSWLLFRQPLASPDFADLVALVVAAGRALAAVVLPLAADALAAPLPLLLVRLLGVEAHAGRRLLRPEAGLPVGVPVSEAVAGRRRSQEEPRHVGRGLEGLVGGRNGGHLTGRVGRMIGLGLERPSSVRFLPQLGGQSWM